MNAADSARMVADLCFNRALRRSSNRLFGLYDHALAACGLRGAAFGLMAQIQASGTIGIVELADIFILDRASLRYRLAPLDRAGLVELVADPRDKRSRRIRLTARGEAKLAEALPLWQAVQDRIDAQIGREDAAALRAMTNRIASSAFAEAVLG